MFLTKRFNLPEGDGVAALVEQLLLGLPGGQVVLAQLVESSLQLLIPVVSPIENFEAYVSNVIWLTIVLGFVQGAVLALARC